MIRPASRYFALGHLPCIFLTLASYFACLGAAFAADAQHPIQVIDINSSAPSEQTRDARAAFLEGKAIVRMVGGSQADFNRLLGSQFGDFRAYRNSAQAQTRGARQEIKLQEIAAYIDGKGITRSVLSFAPDGQGQDHVADWIAREQSKTSIDSNAPQLLGGPSSAFDSPNAWTLLYTVTLQVFANSGFGQSTDAVYRVNTNSFDGDYYLVTTLPETQPRWDGVCDGVTECGWHTLQRNFDISADVGQLANHGPTGTITTETAGFTIGGGFTTTGPNGSAGFTASWSQPSVTTTDNSGASKASWTEQFNFIGVPCVPVVNTMPDVSSGTFVSEQAALFRVPNGTPNVNFQVHHNSQSCAYYDGFLHDPPPGLHAGNNYDWISLEGNFVISPPVFEAFPKSLTIPAGGTAPVLVNASIPNSSQAFNWTITSNSSWLTVPSSTPYSFGRVIPVTVAAGHADGDRATLTVDTSPPFAAPSVTGGALTINVTVGTPEAGPAAGVLVSGGHDSNQIVAPYFYNVATNDIIPLSFNVPRTASTATLLKTGQVLVAGGATQYLNTIGAVAPTNTAELFQPGLLTFSRTGSLNVARMGATAVLLDDGKVLVIGGRDANGASISTAELYDPATGKFTPAGTLKEPHHNFYASLISQPGEASRVLVYGGEELGWEMWEEPANDFVILGTMPSPAFEIPQPLPLTDGTLDLAGGWNQQTQQPVGQEQLLTPNSDPSFQVGGDINVARGSAALAPLPDGRLLLTGGVTGLTLVGSVFKATYTGTAEIRNSSAWSLLSPDSTCPDNAGPGNPGCMIVARANHTATLLPDGRVFIVGGNSTAGVVAQSEFFDPTSKRFEAGPVTPAEFGHKAVALATTETSVLATPAVAPFGQTVKFAATVTAPSGTPTGIIHFLDGQTEIGSAQLAQGQASIATDKLSVGSHSVTASYTGNGLFIPSVSAALNFVVGGELTQTALTVSPSPAEYQAPVTLTAAVTSGSAVVTGSVVFKDGSTTLASADLVNGVAKTQVTNFSTGLHSLSASFNGSDQWGSSTGNASLVVRAATTSNLQSNLNPSHPGDQVTFTVKVSGGGTSNTPSGTVNFTDGGASLGSAPLKSDGSAELATTALKTGSHPIVATYSGDTNFSGSTSGVLTQTVRAHAQTGTSTTLTSEPNPSTAGASVTFTATVSAAAGASGTPTGTVEFTDQTANVSLGSSTIVAVNGSQLAVLTTGALTGIGSHIIQAAYGGDGNFTASSSAPYTQTVSSAGGGKVTPTVDLLANNSLNTTISVGDSVTFVAKIHAAPGYPVPTGSITISDSTNANNRYGAANITKDPTSNDGLATVVSSGIPAGNYTLIATYGGDNEGKYYNGAQSNTVGLTVKADSGASNPGPQPNLLIAIVPGARSGLLLPLTLTVTNSSATPVSGVILNQIVAHALAGGGEASLLSPSTPISLGNLEPGASTEVTLELQVPTTVRKLAFIESGTFQTAGGAVYHFSPGQVVFP